MQPPGRHSFLPEPRGHSGQLRLDHRQGSGAQPGSDRAPGNDNHHDSAQPVDDARVDANVHGPNPGTDYHDRGNHHYHPTRSPRRDYHHGARDHDDNDNDNDDDNGSDGPHLHHPGADDDLDNVHYDDHDSDAVNHHLNHNDNESAPVNDDNDGSDHHHYDDNGPAHDNRDDGPNYYDDDGSAV